MAFTMRFGGGDRRGGGGGGRNGGDTTKQAEKKPNEIQLVVWYTEAIPLSIGPDTYSGLPGAILEVDSDNGSNVISALNYIPKFSAKELKQPTKGKKIKPCTIPNRNANDHEGYAKRWWIWWHENEFRQLV